MVAGLVSRVERVEDWKIKNHPILQSPNPPMASALQKETEERRDKLENMVWTNLMGARVAGNFSVHHENMLRTNSRCAQKKQKKTKGTAVPRPFRPITHSFFSLCSIWRVRETLLCYLAHLALLRTLQQLASTLFQALASHRRQHSIRY